MTRGVDKEMFGVDPLLMDVLVDYYRHPHNYGDLDNADVVHEEGNPSCGDRIKISLKLKDGRIDDIKFSGEGCIISQAAASILTDSLKGQPIERVKDFTRDEMLDSLGIPIGPMRLKCALLALKVLKAGVYGQAPWPGEEE